jgi:hypothetical protein
LENFIEKNCALIDTEQPLNVSTRRNMQMFSGHDPERVGIHHRYRLEEVSSSLGAQTFSSKDRIFGPRDTLEPAITERLGPLAHRLTCNIQQNQPERLLQRWGSSRDSSLVSTILTKIPPAPVTTTFSSTKLQRRDESVESGQAISTEVTTKKRSESRPLANAKEVAERVYRLMQRELILERERANRSGG